MTSLVNDLVIFSLESCAAVLDRPFSLFLHDVIPTGIVSSCNSNMAQLQGGSCVSFHMMQWLSEIHLLGVEICSLEALS